MRRLGFYGNLSLFPAQEIELMHIADGILDVKICAGGLAAAVVLAGVSLKGMKKEAVPRISIMGAAFFVSSLIHFKIGFTSVHLTLIGLTGIILGGPSILAVIAGLFFQAAMFGHGGLSTLGINAVVMYLPALFAFGGFKIAVKKFRHRKNILSIFSGVLSGMAVLLASLLVFGVLYLSAEENIGIAFVFSVSNAVLALFEAVLTFLIIRQILNVKPELIPGVI